MIALPSFNRGMLSLTSRRFEMEVAFFIGLLGLPVIVAGLIAIFAGEW